MIGQRFKIARAASGLSLRALEERIGNRVTAQAIGKYERNESMPGSGTLMPSPMRLASRWIIWSGTRKWSWRRWTSGRRRSRAGERNPRSRPRSWIFWSATSWSRSCSNFGVLNGTVHARPPTRSYATCRKPTVPPTAFATTGGLAATPIPNLVELLEEQGIKVLAVELRNIDGLMARVRRVGKGTVPVIVVNHTHWGERQRLTLAHELGHLVMDVAARVDEEKAAYRFAGAFLMPADSMRAAIGKHRTSVGWEELFGLKRLFGVSVQAVTYRCKDLDIFSETLFRRLFNEITHRGWRTPPYEEPDAMKGEKPMRSSA